MKTIEIDDALYQYLVQHTEFIGESASDILRRLLGLSAEQNETTKITKKAEPVAITSTTSSVASAEDVTPSVAASATFKELRNYINKEELAIQRGVVGRFLLILSALYRVNKPRFDKVLQIKGRDRLYFALSETELAESGSSTKPRQIPESPFWVMTNSNTTRKKMMLTEAAIALGYNAEDAEHIRELL